MRLNPAPSDEERQLRSRVVAFQVRLHERPTNRHKSGLELSSETRKTHVILGSTSAVRGPELSTNSRTTVAINTLSLTSRSRQCDTPRCVSVDALKRSKTERIISQQREYVCCDTTHR
jgi:hypothetical protein